VATKTAVVTCKGATNQQQAVLTEAVMAVSAVVLSAVIMTVGAKGIIPKRTQSTSNNNSSQQMQQSTGSWQQQKITATSGDKPTATGKWQQSNNKRC